MITITNTPRFAGFLFLTLGLWGTSLADFTLTTEKHTIKVTKVISGLHSPWSIAFLSEHEWLITEKGGKLRHVVNGKLKPDPVAGLPKISATGQGGLLDVALHPEFTENRLVYLSYVASDKNGLGTEVLRGRFNGDALENIEILFKALPKSRGSRHFGSRLAFDTANHLFISLGDRGVRPNGQALDTHPGSLIRLNDDGTLPKDNPFIDDQAVQTEIYSYGHRNIQGLSFDKSTNKLWSHEHGPKGGDELNLIQKGNNYGWPVITWGANYGTGTEIGEGTHKADMEQPVTKWVPSIAPSGMTPYGAGPFDRWQGNIFIGALKFQLLVRLEMNGDKVVHEERILEGRIGRIRDVRTGPDGFLYLLTDSRRGAVYRLEPVVD